MSVGRALSRIILFGVAVGPPSVVALSRWRWLTGRPEIAVILLLGYEALVALIGFVGLVWGNLRSEWARRISVKIDQAAERRLSRFERRYRDYLRESLRFVDQKGLATLGDRTPELDDVFVDLSMAKRPPQQISRAVLSEPPISVTERRSVWEFLSGKAPAVLAIIGAPGSGKTTLLRHAARRLAGEHRRSGLPVLLLLREWASLIVKDPGLSLAAVTSAQAGEWFGKVPPGWFELRLATSRCAVMLDGLDEIARAEDRQSVVDWVNRQIVRYPGNDYLITSRPHGYQEYPVERATVLQVRTFTPRQIALFVRGWYLAIERYSTGTDTEHVKRKALDEADDLLARLRHNPPLADLAANPLLLTMIANVHRYRGALPGTRAELYAEMCQVLLGRRQQAKRLTTSLRADKKEVVLRELAFTMMNDRVRDLPYSRATEVIRSVLPRVSISLSAREFFDDIRSNGLLLESERNLCCFAHHSFQEYLAAAHIRERGHTEVLLQNVADSWWRETTLLYVARADAGPVIEACITSEKTAALVLAFDCANAASELDPAVRDRLDRLLSDAADSTTAPERRMLAASVIASRQLEETIKLDNGTQVCAKPISRRLYELFIDQVSGDGQIEGAERSRPANYAQAEDPAVGVRAEYAIAFVEWLNSLLNGEIVYRLPTLGESRDAVLNDDNSTTHISCVWATLDNDRECLNLWTSLDTNNPYAVTGDQVRKAAEADIAGPIGQLMTSVLTLALANAASSARAICDPASIGINTALDSALERAQSHADRLRLNDAYDLVIQAAKGDPSEVSAGRRNPGQQGLGLDHTGERNLFRDSFRGLFRREGDAGDGTLDIDEHRIYRPDNHPDPANRVYVRANARGRARREEYSTKARQQAFDVALSYARALDPTLDQAISLASTGSFRRRTDQTLDDDLDISMERDVEQRLDRDLDRAIAGISELALPMCSFLARRSLPTSASSDPAAVIWHDLLSITELNFEERVVLPDALHRNAKSGNEEILRGRYFRCTMELSSQIADRLLSASKNENLVTHELVSYVRLGSLAVAASIATRSVGSELAMKYIDIASGITALERRTQGGDSFREMIILARG